MPVTVTLKPGPHVKFIRRGQLCATVSVKNAQDWGKLRSFGNRANLKSLKTIRKKLAYFLQSGKGEVAGDRACRNSGSPVNLQTRRSGQ